MGTIDIPKMTTAKDAKKLFAAAQSQTLTLPKVRALMEELGTIDDDAAAALKDAIKHAHKDAFSPAGRKLFNDYVAGKTGPGHLKDPRLDPDNEKSPHKWVEVKGTLALDATTAEDYQQNKLGDCFYVSSARGTMHWAEVWAKIDGEPPRNYISEMQRLSDPSKPESSDVEKRWFLKDKSGAFHERWVKMTRDLPVDNDGNLLYAGDKRHLCTAYDEKGAALMFTKAMSAADGKEKKERGYGRMDGGWAGTAFETLTGQPSKSYSIITQPKQKPDEGTEAIKPSGVWNVMREALLQRKAIGLGTPGDDPTDYSNNAAHSGARKKPVPSKISPMVAAKIQAQEPFDSRTLDAMKIITGHEYSVWNLTYTDDKGNKLDFIGEATKEAAAKRAGKSYDNIFRRDDLDPKRCGVVVSNPWGDTEPDKPWPGITPDKTDDGIFEISLETALRCYTGVDVSGTLPPRAQTASSP